MINKDKILELKNIIEQKLTPLITQDYALLDIPDHDNIGDNFIWEGEISFLKNIPYQKLYECSLNFFKQEKIPNNAMILMHGGGNFGDIYPIVNEFRLNIIKNNPNKKILIFPQTVHYKDEKILAENSEIINNHPNLTICVRDQKSYETATEHFTNAKVLLLPDMAFCIDLKIFPKNKYTDKTLIMNRMDGEKNLINPLKIENSETLDWPTFNTTKEQRFKKIQRNRRLDKIAKAIQKIPLISKIVDPRYGLKNRKNRENYIQQGIAFFNDYDTIYTTRLHGLILGILMGKKMKILDNNYGKLQSFYNTWLKNFENVETVNLP
ncbi:MAG: polysaccharide pyruvyl transferase family protein [Flavobacteriaceae bacterium]|jgi:pyruvyl transferase EpsO|nr:polysaccharide pyruvyl transferase family protein [Flavobacteriaceae bacterium]